MVAKHLRKIRFHPQLHDRWSGYTIAVAGNLAAWALRLSMRPWLQNEAPYLLSVTVILICSLVGGTGPALLALVLGGMLGLWILHFGDPWGLDPNSHMAGLILYLIAAMVMIALTRSYHKSRRLHSELEKTADELKVSCNKVHELAQRQQSVREEERTSVSRQIHDELGQAMTALKIDIAWLQRRIESSKQSITDVVPTVDSSDRDTLLSRIDSMSHLIDDTITTVRRIATELRPAVLDTLGLVAAIEWQARDFEERTGIACEFATDEDDPPLGRDCSTAIFRILQEALTNVIRHAAASRVWIRLTVKPRRLELTIDDDGVGIDERTAAAGDSLGLMGMCERAMVFGGDIRITRRDGGGTRVVVTIPCPCAGWYCRNPKVRQELTKAVR